jgi:hypothetical protein
MRYSARNIAVAAAALVCFGAVLWAGTPEVDDQLMARRRLFGDIGPGLRALRRGADGKFYVLVSSANSVAVFDAKGAPAAKVPDYSKTAGPASADLQTIQFGEDMDVATNGTVYVADRGANAIKVWGPGGNAREIHVNAPVSVAVLPEDEVAVVTMEQTHLVTVYGPNGRVVREFGDPESLSTRADLNRYVNEGRVASDPQGHLYYGFTYMPEPLVRQYDRIGYAQLDFQFLGVDAFPEAQATRKEIEKQEARANKPPSLRPILTAFGVDPVSGDLWMALHNTLLHFDKDGNRRSEYQIYTPKGARIEASIIVVEEERLLIGADPVGIYDFLRPDKRH